MRRQQATSAYDLQRQLRRRFLVDTTLRVLGGAVIVLLAWAFLFALLVLGS